MRRRTASRALTATVLAAALLPPPASASGPAATAVETTKIVACRTDGPCWPTAFAFTPNGKQLFYAERFTGHIRRYHLEKKTDRRWGKVGGIATSGEQGLLGLALDPRWPGGSKHRWVYLYLTKADPLTNRIVRKRKKADGTFATRRLASIPAGVIHNGGQIAFGPDGMLYAVTGDAGVPSRAQDTASSAGKVLRLRKNGGRPDSNPIPDSTAYSYGHRNSFGLAFDPQTGGLWQTENGPECDDEANRIEAGGNYGWGAGSSCPNTSTSGPGPIPPSWTWNPTIAPTGAAFCDGCKLGAANRGALLVGAWNDGAIRRLQLSDDRHDVTGETVILTSGSGILAMAAGPGGRVYFSDPNGIHRLKKT